MVIVAVVVAIVISIPLVRNRFVECYQKYKKKQRTKDRVPQEADASLMLTDDLQRLVESGDLTVPQAKTIIKTPTTREWACVQCKYSNSLACTHCQICGHSNAEQNAEQKVMSKSSEKELSSKGDQVGDEEKEKGIEVHEINEVSAKDGIHQQIKKMKTSLKSIQSYLGSSTAADRDELLKMITLTMNDFVSENVKKQALEVQAEVQAHVKTLAKKNVSGAPVMNAIKSKTNSVKSKYLWSGSEQEKEEKEEQKTTYMYEQKGEKEPQKNTQKKAVSSAARARPHVNSDSNIMVHNNNNQSATGSNTTKSLERLKFNTKQLANITDPEKVEQLCGMGFTPDQASGALLAYNNDVSKACNHLLGMHR